jgi:hypothetical protein
MTVNRELKTEEKEIESIDQQQADNTKVSEVLSNSFLTR